jgi:hypothetical protein
LKRETAQGLDNMTLRRESQYVLPFDAARNDLLAQIRFLRACDLQLSPGRLEGVVQFLERLALLGNDLSERAGMVVVKAQIIAIAARVESRRSVADRTVRNWRKDCEALGIVSTEVRSQKWGRNEWNHFTIYVDRIREIVAGRGVPNEAGSGRKWPETIAAPGPETIAAPGPEMVAALSNVVFQGSVLATKQGERFEFSTVAKPRIETPDNAAVDRLIDAYNACEVYGAAELLSRALPRVGREYLERLLDVYRRKPGAWGPGALRNRVNHSQPGLDPAQGWPPPRTIAAPAFAPRSRPTPEELAARSAEFARDREAARASGGLSDDEREALRAAGLVRSKSKFANLKSQI